MSKIKYKVCRSCHNLYIVSINHMIRFPRICKNCFELKKQSSPLLWQMIDIANLLLVIVVWLFLLLLACGLAVYVFEHLLAVYISIPIMVFFLIKMVWDEVRTVKQKEIALENNPSQAILIKKVQRFEDIKLLLSIRYCYNVFWSRPFLSFFVLICIVLTFVFVASYIEDDKVVISALMCGMVFWLYSIGFVSPKHFPQGTRIQNIIDCYRERLKVVSKK